MKLFLKGTRCSMAKCPIETGRPSPGVHGQRRGRKNSDYGVQLRQKQALKRQYGLVERQFHGLFEKALRSKGMTGEKLLQLLEMRLDNLLYRMGVTASRRAARQMVLHGHVTVNQKRASVPSMLLKPGCTITVKDKTKSREMAKQVLEKESANRLVPSWLTFDAATFTGEVVRIPSRDEIAPIVDEQLIVELYSR